MAIPLAKGRFFGDTLRRRLIEDFTVSDIRFPPEVRVPRHSHLRPIFNFVLAGAYTEYWGRKRVECRPRSLLFHPVGADHSERFSRAGARCLVVEFDPGRLERMETSAEPRDHGLFPAGDVGWVASRLRGELYHGDDLTPLVLEGLLHLLLVETVRRREPTECAPPPFVERARELLDDTFRERPSMAAVAEAAGVHPSHLARAFRRWYDCTPGEYVRRARVEFACARLAEGSDSLAAIAHAAGFTDQSHFTRTFRRLTGTTPGAYRSALG